MDPVVGGYYGLKLKRKRNVNISVRDSRPNEDRSKLVILTSSLITTEISIQNHVTHIFRLVPFYDKLNDPERRH